MVHVFRTGRIWQKTKRKSSCRSAVLGEIQIQQEIDNFEFLLTINYTGLKMIILDEVCLITSYECQYKPTNTIIKMCVLVSVSSYIHFHKRSLHTRTVHKQSFETVFLQHDKLLHTCLQIFYLIIGAFLRKSSGMSQSNRKFHQSMKTNNKSLQVILKSLNQLNSKKLQTITAHCALIIYANSSSICQL